MTEFVTVDEYVSYVLDQVLSELERQEGTSEAASNGKDAATGSALSQEGEEDVEKRLKELGYI